MGRREFSVQILTKGTNKGIYLRGGQIANAQATGVAPLSIASTTPVANLTLTAHPQVYEAGVLTTSEKIYTNTQALTRGAATHTFANSFYLYLVIYLRLLLHGPDGGGECVQGSSGECENRDVGWNGIGCTVAELQRALRPSWANKTRQEHRCNCFVCASGCNVPPLLTDPNESSRILAFRCLWYLSPAMPVRSFIATPAKLLPQAGWRELVPCGFATHHDAHSCGMRHRA